MTRASGVTAAAYDWHDASPEVLDAMAFRCAEEGHDWRGGASAFLRIFMFCHWCGVERPDHEWRTPRASKDNQGGDK